MPDRAARAIACNSEAGVDAGTGTRSLQRNAQRSATTASSARDHPRASFACGGEGTEAGMAADSDARHFSPNNGRSTGMRRIAS